MKVLIVDKLSSETVTMLQKLGLLVEVRGDLTDGLGLIVDDGSGQIRVIVGPDALGGLPVPSGTLVVATGPVGQRDSTGTGLAGYRIHATEAGALASCPRTRFW